MATAEQASLRQTISNGERAVIELLTAVFDTSAEVATQSYMKLKTYITRDKETRAMFESATQQTLDDDYDGVVERTRQRAVSWDIAAIARQVIMPMAGGVLGYAVAGAIGLTGGVPILIGFLVGTIIWLMMAPGTLNMLKEKMNTALSDIFSPFG